MIYLNKTPEQMLAKYNIKPIEENCRGCGELIQVNIPVISKDFVGYESNTHNCGKQYKIMLLKPMSEEILTSMREAGFDI